MKLLSFVILFAALLLSGAPVTEASGRDDLRVQPSRARIHATLRVSQTVLGIEVIIPTSLYTARNLNTNVDGTIINVNLQDVVVQEGDVLYLNTLSSPLAIFYTVTADDIASGAIQVLILS